MKLNLLILFSMFMNLAAFSQDFFSPNDAYELSKSNKAVIVDIREQSEWEQSGLAAPAVWLANSSIEAKDAAYLSFINSQDKEKSIVLYCRSGRRASRALVVFKELGFKVYNMGGLVHWKNAGLPLKSRP